MDRLVVEPNFFIVGAPKSGTTNISYYLMQHPQVFMPENLEPYYFARLDIPQNYEREIISNEKKYLNLFKNTKSCRAIGESSPVYLYCPHSALEIKNRFPNSKIIISLRNPIEIAYSEYFSLKFMGFDKNASFNELLNSSEEQLTRNEFHIDSLLEAGFYSKHIKRFQEIFSKNQIKIIIFEEYIKNTIPTINSILSFLDIQKSIIFKTAPKGAYKIPRNFASQKLMNNFTFRKAAKFIIPTVARQKIGERFLVKESSRPPLKQNERQRLKEIYQDDVENLDKLLGRRLPWKDFY
tara:strand:+ start:51 stop:935 length:885 start_codon:yes stop_codon:yes gene_type:complete